GVNAVELVHSLPLLVLFVIRSETLSRRERPHYAFLSRDCQPIDLPVFMTRFSADIRAGSEGQHHGQTPGAAPHIVAMKRRVEAVDHVREWRLCVREIFDTEVQPHTLPQIAPQAVLKHIPEAGIEL